jgi:hypothetical protein
MPRLLLAMFLVLVFAPSAFAGPCQHDTDACVTSLFVAPSVIPGDQFAEAVAIGQIHIPQIANGSLIALVPRPHR